MPFPKFEEKIKEKIVQPAFDTSTTPGYGIIINYDAVSNTATVQMAQSGSGSIGAVLNNVPCPTSVGIQGVAPEPGRPCFVMYKDNISNPVIVTYFNHKYAQIDYARQTQAINNTPRFLMQI